MFPHTVVALDTRVRKAACGEALFWKAAALFFKMIFYLRFAEAQNLGLYLVSRGLRGMVSALTPSTLWTPWPAGSGASARTPSTPWTPRRSGPDEGFQWLRRVVSGIPWSCARILVATARVCW